MELPVNQFKRSMKAGKAQIGLWSSLSSHYSVEVIAGSGFDWLLIVTEHSPNDLENVVTQLQAASAYPTTAVVRPAWNDMVLIKRFLDVGVQTLLIPYVQTAQEAADAVAYTRYPPRGVRGVAGTTRATRFGRIKDYFKRADEELCVLLQVETRQALDNLDAIAATDGVDGVFIGPFDLSAGLGHLGDIPHPEVQKAIDDSIRRIRKAGKAAGILAPVEADAHRYLDQGCLFVAVGADVGLLARESEKLCARFKS
jgi:4-hydroxy-2-oxoheptanedioate aldolase